MRLLPWLGLLLIFGTSFAYATETPFPGVAAVLPVLGAALLLPSGARQSSARVVLENRAIQFFGSVSYSWYLWHWPVLVLAGLVWKLNLGGRMVCVLVSIALAWLTQRLVENPVRFHPALLPKPGFSMALTGGLTLLSVAVCASFYLGASHLETTREQVKFTRAVKDLPIIDRDGCNVGYEPTESPGCIFGDTSSSTVVILFGDSHAGQWFPAFNQIARDNHWKLIDFTKSACPSATLARLYDRNIGRNYDECAKWRLNTIQKINALHPALVITSNYSSYYLTRAGISADQWRDGLQITLVQLAGAGNRILVLHDPPAPSFDVPVCLARAAWTNSGDSCSFEPDLALNRTIAQLEKTAAQHVSNTQVADISSLICTGGECDSLQNGNMLYRDQHHLTASYVLGLAPVLEPKMAGLMMRHLN